MYFIQASAALTLSDIPWNGPIGNKDLMQLFKP